MTADHSDAPIAGTAAPRWLPWLFAAAGLVFDLIAYWPGQMSFDSAYAWWQVRGGATTDIVPPVFVLVWRVCDALLAGPGLVFALHLVLFWCGLALLVRALRFGALAAVAGMLIVAWAPVVLLLRGHVWTDVGLFSALTFAAGALATAQAGSQRRWLLFALPALVYAGALRHNALPAVLPFALWLGWLVGRARTGTAARLRCALGAAAPIVLSVLLMLSAGASVQTRVPLWPMLAQWDLAAISIAADEMLLPDFMIGPGLDVPELAEAFRPWSTSPMLQNTRHGMHDPLGENYSATQLTRLRQTWLAAIAAHPRAWLAHRWHLTRALFGNHGLDWPHELVFVDDEVAYRDNPPIARNSSALHRFLLRPAQALASTPVLAAWPYLLIGLAAVPAAWRRRRAASGSIALIALASAWLYALPFTLIAASAELRYLGWPCVASLLAAICAWLAPRPSAR